MGGVESRAHPRAQARIKVEYHFGSSTGVGFTKDISEGGIFLGCQRMAPTGTRIYLRLNLPGSQAGEPLKVIGLVTRAVEPKAGAPEEEAGGGMGIHFEVAYARTREALSDFVENLLAMPGAGAKSDIQLVPGATSKRPEYAVRLPEARTSSAGKAGNYKPLTAAQVERAFAFGSGVAGEVNWPSILRASAYVAALMLAVALVGWGVSCITGLLHAPGR